MKSDGVNAARRLAVKMWGEIQTQNKLADGIWMFSTAGHGGIIVDTDKCQEFEEMKEFVPCSNKEHSSPTSGFVSEQHFAPFEEDCEAALVEWLYAYKIWRPAFRKLYVNSAETDEQWYKKREKMLRRTIESYHPEFIEKFPEIRKTEPKEEENNEERKE